MGPGDWGGCKITVPKQHQRRISNIFFFDFQLSYTSPYMSILKVFDMMAGGVEFNHYFVEKPLPMPELARVVCFTFILIMSISLMNLLVSKDLVNLRF